MVKDIRFIRMGQEGMYIEPSDLSKRIITIDMPRHPEELEKEEEFIVPSIGHETLHMVLSKVAPKKGLKMQSGMHPEEHEYVMSIDRPDIGGYLSEIGPSGLPEIEYIERAAFRPHINPRLRRLLE